MSGINQPINDSIKKIKINMAAQGVHKITADFEDALCKYTGAPYAVALDNASNALFLALHYELHVNREHGIYWLISPKKISIPSNTYPSVPCEIIHAGARVEFEGIHPNSKRFADTNSYYLTGAYPLKPTKIWDSALRFTHNMYQKGTHMCLSFTGPYKHLKLGKGGAILTDDENAYKWFKKARFSGRDECSYHVDEFDHEPVIGWNFYMMPEIAARGLLLMGQFYNQDGSARSNPDLELPYPDLRNFKLWQ
jgi:dTDP-4-amino-4,6-dideoxygalactose transaminase